MIYLALIAVVEAVVYQRRYRSATHGGPIEAAWWALCTCVLRFAAPLLGVSEFFRGGDPVLLTAVYAVPAAIATGLVRTWELRPRSKLGAFVSDQERADAEKHRPPPTMGLRPTSAPPIHGPLGMHGMGP